MNNVYFNDPNFIATQSYQDYIKENPNRGYLSIRAYAANAAIPISGLNVIVSKIINNRRVIFFEGATDTSGIISQIALPTPNISSSAEDIPASQEYDLEASYNNQQSLFVIKMYANIQVNQNVNIVPELRLEGSTYGS